LGRTSGWSLFVACMFLGLGIGMLFDQAGAGIIIGMGIGFVLEALASKGVGTSETKKLGEKAGTPGHGDHIGPLIFVFMGIGFILGGLYMAGIITIPEIVWEEVGAVIMIALGIMFLLAALCGIRKPT